MDAIEEEGSMELTPPIEDPMDLDIERELADHDDDDDEAMTNALLTGWNFESSNAAGGDDDDDASGIIRRVKKKRANDNEFVGCQKPEVQKQILEALDMSRQEYADMVTNARSELGQVFVPAWKEFEEGYLSLVTDKKTKGVELPTVIRFLKNEGGDNLMRNMLPPMEARRGWKAVQWNAYIFYKIKALLYDADDSFLKRRGFTASQAQRMCWDIKINRSHAYTHSRAGRRADKAKADKTGRARRQAAQGRWRVEDWNQADGMQTRRRMTKRKRRKRPRRHARRPSSRRRSRN